MYHKHLTTLSLMLAILCITATLAVAIEMTCSQDQETVMAFPQGGRAVSRNCTMVKGSDGTEVPVSVPGRRTGEKLRCVAKNGKIDCSEVPYGYSGSTSNVTK